MPSDQLIVYDMHGTLFGYDSDQKLAVFGDALSALRTTRVNWQVGIFTSAPLEKAHSELQNFGLGEFINDRYFLSAKDLQFPEKDLDAFRKYGEIAASMGARLRAYVDDNEHTAHQASSVFESDKTALFPRVYRVDRNPKGISTLTDARLRIATVASLDEMINREIRI